MARPKRENRESEANRNTSFKPPSLLDAPPAPEGFRHRYVAYEVAGKSHDANISRKFRMGYEPVKASEYPDWHPPTIESGRMAGYIGHSGLVLCRIPEEISDKYRTMYEGKAQAMDQAVENDFFRLNNPVMPLSGEKKTSFTTGNNPEKEE